MVENAAMGWPEVSPGTWPHLRDDFAKELESLAAFGSRSARDRRLDPPIEFLPLASYTVGDALIHVANHNAHHLGQVIVLRQMMGSWPPPSGGWTW